MSHNFTIQSIMRVPSAANGIRCQYQEYGSTGYYEKFGAAYRNPHELIIGELFKLAAAEWNFELSSWQFLDLACGSGEATLALEVLGCTQVEGADPFTGEAYLKRTGQHAEAIYFADIATGVLQSRRFDVCVCSFAMHLAPLSLLPQLCLQLSLCCARLLILTPHKRPYISSDWGWNLNGEIMQDRVRARFYESLNFS